MHSMKKWTMMAVLTGLLALSAPLAAQEAAGMDRVRTSFPGEAADEIARIVADAEAEGLPTAPVVAKALEGAAKGVPADRVVSAVSAYADRLQRASGLLPEGAPTDGIVSASDALRRGATPDAVRDVGARAGDASPEALVVLGDLAEAGVPVDQAVEVVTEALAQGRRGQGLLAMPAAVRRLTRQGTPPGQAARAVAMTLAGKGPPSGVPPVQLPPQAGGPPVPPGAGPPDRAGSPDDAGPPDDGGPPDDPPGGGPPGGGSGGSGSGG